MRLVQQHSTRRGPRGAAWWLAVVLVLLLVLFLALGYHMLTGPVIAVVGATRDGPVLEARRARKRRPMVARRHSNTTKQTLPRCPVPGEAVWGPLHDNRSGKDTLYLEQVGDNHFNQIVFHGGDEERVRRVDVPGDGDCLWHSMYPQAGFASASALKAAVLQYYKRMQDPRGGGPDKKVVRQELAAAIVGDIIGEATHARVANEAVLDALIAKYYVDGDMDKGVRRVRDVIATRIMDIADGRGRRGYGGAPEIRAIATVAGARGVGVRMTPGGPFYPMARFGA